MKITPEILIESRNKKGLSQQQVADHVGISQRTYSGYEKGEMSPKADKIEKLLEVLDLKSSKGSLNKIPLYEDVSTIGGTNMVAEPNSVYYPAEYIDAGDLFPGATAAIRHYGESMIEYRSGCILLLKEVSKEFFIWGEDYVIELPEFKIGRAHV